MTLVEKERLCQQELDELRRLIDLDLSAYPADVEAALRFIHDHLFEESLNASRVQRREGLRSHNLPARFKRHLGLGLRDYIEDRRIMAAMRLLWHQEVEIYLVAAAVGYAHHETFTRAFKRRVGCPPSEFRAHFTTAPVANGPPAAPPGAPASEGPPAAPLPSDPPPREAPSPGAEQHPPPPYDPAPHPREVLMFITDVVGIRTADETYELRVRGTATGVAEVYVTASASGETRTQVAEVGPEGRWVALFGAEEDVFSCGRPLLVEVGREGRTQVQWEGPLDCAEVAPRRQRAPQEAVAEGADSGERSASRSHGGGNYAGEAAMTVTVATGRGPAPPPLIASDEGDEEAVPYYEKARPTSPSREKDPSSGGDPARHGEAASERSARELREEVAELRAQIATLVQDLQQRPSEASAEEAPAEAEAVSPVSAPDEAEETGESASSGSSTESSDNLREEIAALRRELHEQRTSKEQPAQTEQVPSSAAEAPPPVEKREQVDEEEEDATDSAWRREIRDLRKQVETLRDKTESQAASEEREEAPEEREGGAVASSADDAEGAESPAWQRAFESLQDQIEALRTSDATKRGQGGEESEGQDEGMDDPTPSERDESSDEEHAVSPRENRADLYDAVSALRERIAELERSESGHSDDPERSDAHVEARRPQPVRREAREEEPREAPPDDRGPGVLARQRVEERDDRRGQPSASGRRSADRATPPARRDDREGLRREDAPIIKFEPFEVGDWTDDGQREVRVRARITHPSRRPVAAELSDDRDDRVLADGRSERGTLTLDEWVELAPGTATFTVTVTEPTPARLSTAWTLDEPDEKAAVEEGEPEEETGWVSRAIGGAWGLSVALFLLSLAAGVHGFLRGAITAGFLGFFGSYLALTVPHRWGVWTAAGIGLFVLSLIALLPFTPIVQMDSYLLIAGLATLGLAGAAVVALFVTSD